MFAREEGAVAAPTAALHFTPRLLEALDEQGVGRETLTLHVGAGTFLPVKADDTIAHKMHAEWGRIEQATAKRLNAVRASGGRLIAVGTTSLRLLESAATDDGCIRPFEGDTAIFITPGYRFKAIDGLITNFHLPKSTLFMQVPEEKSDAAASQRPVRRTRVARLCREESACQGKWGLALNLSTPAHRQNFGTSSLNRSILQLPPIRE